MQFEITTPTRDAAEAWIREAGLRSEDYLFPSRTHHSPHICTRQYARMLREWLQDIGLDWHDYGTHSMRRTKDLPKANSICLDDALGGNSMCNDLEVDLKSTWLVFLKKTLAQL